MNKRVKTGLIWTFVGIMLAVMYIPIIILIVYSFTDAKALGVWSGFSFELYKDLFTNSSIMNAFKNSFILAFVAAALATVLGTTAAIGIYYMRKWKKTTANFIANITMENAEIVTGVTFMMFFLALRLPYGWTTLIIAHTMITVPYVILSVTPKLAQLNPNLYEAGVDLGCSPIRSMLTVVVPQLIPGMISGFVMAFALSLDDFIVSKFVNGSIETIPVYLYNALAKRGADPTLRALSAILFVAVLAVLIALNVVSAKRKKKALMAAK
ncbi:MAG: ABC transporter permease [Clostridiales bacterium]|nr:ABC transporter permease [Clostridiales bacterium]